METMLLSIDEAARALRLSPWTIRAMARDGRIRTVKLSRRTSRRHGLQHSAESLLGFGSRGSNCQAEAAGLARHTDRLAHSFTIKRGNDSIEGSGKPWNDSGQ
jgi:excisionase family DNA binding protein